ncbi:MAG: hemerythrin family protein [Clostridiales bacterium]|nr:hemerythrin family protein [Clostridiales bacterium]
MPYEGVAWKDKYRLGNEQVDEQHHQLFVLVSELIASCEDGNDACKLKETLDFLVEYTIHHFNDEEALQLRYNFPDLERHKKLHEEFKVTAQELQRHFAESGSSVELSNDVSKIVVKWLISHILNEDKKIGVHIRSVKEQA